MVTFKGYHELNYVKVRAQCHYNINGIITNVTCVYHHNYQFGVGFKEHLTMLVLLKLWIDCCFRAHMEYKCPDASALHGSLKPMSVRLYSICARKQQSILIFTLSPSFCLLQIF